MEEAALKVGQKRPSDVTLEKDKNFKLRKIDLEPLTYDSPCKNSKQAIEEDEDLNEMR